MSVVMEDPAGELMKHDQYRPPSTSNHLSQQEKKPPVETPETPTKHMFFLFKRIVIFHRFLVLFTPWTNQIPPQEGGV